MKCGAPGIRVVKIGGSLLDLPDLKSRIRAWSSRRFFRSTLWIVGGGEAVNQIRARRNIRGNPAKEHWECIEVMDANSRRIADWFPEWGLATDPTRDQCSGPLPGNSILLTRNWLDENTGLPQNWDVTSDSIALEVAKATRAMELVLLKSCSPKAGKSIEELVESGFVDQHFKQSIRERGLELSLRLVNFRSEDFGEKTFRFSEDQTVKDC